MSKWVWNESNIWASLLNSASRQCCEVWAFQYHFFIILRTLFLLEKLVFINLLTNLCYRSSNNLPLAFFSLQTLREVTEPCWGLVFSLIYKSHMWTSLVGSLWQRSLAQTLELRVIIVAGSPLVVMHLVVALTLRGRAVGDSVPNVLESTNLLS